jgi:hypothetical protein
VRCPGRPCAASEAPAAVLHAAPRWHSCRHWLSAHRCHSSQVQRQQPCQQECQQQCLRCLMLGASRTLQMCCMRPARCGGCRAAMRHRCCRCLGEAAPDRRCSVLFNHSKSVSDYTP